MDQFQLGSFVKVYVQGLLSEKDSVLEKGLLCLCYYLMCYLEKDFFFLCYLEEDSYSCMLNRDFYSCMLHRKGLLFLYVK